MHAVIELVPCPFFQNQDLGYDSNKPVRAILLLNVLPEWQTKWLLSLVIHCVQSPSFPHSEGCDDSKPIEGCPAPRYFSITAEYMVLELSELL